jgi:putative transposase
MERRKRHTAAAIAAKLEEARALETEGRTQSEIAKALGISVMTFHRWRKTSPARSPTVYYAASPTASNRNLSESERLNRIDELRLENARLRKLVTDLMLEKVSLYEDSREAASRFRQRRAD